jgi:hypothetical protein
MTSAASSCRACASAAPRARPAHPQMLGRQLAQLLLQLQQGPVAGRRLVPVDGVFARIDVRDADDVMLKSGEI